MPEPTAAIDDSSDGSADLRTARDWLRQAPRVAVLTGAGISAESGVPTFRDTPTGYWAQFRAEDMATERGFRANPQRVWDWYAYRREVLSAVAPHAGHLALAHFAQRHPGRLTLITQNVDGLHQRARSPDVLCLHGDIFANRWLQPRRSCCDLAKAVPGSPPQCSVCGNQVRPGVVWFGEGLPMDTFNAAQAAAQQCALMLVVGTAGAVYPAAGLAHSARAAGARVLVVNTADSALDEVADLVLRGPAGDVLPRLLAGD